MKTAWLRPLHPDCQGCGEVGSRLVILQGAPVELCRVCQRAGRVLFNGGHAPFEVCQLDTLRAYRQHQPPPRVRV